jgi:hypothetical protein
VPSTTLREVSLLRMLGQSNHVVKSVARCCYPCAVHPSLRARLTGCSRKSTSTRTASQSSTWYTAHAHTAIIACRMLYQDALRWQVFEYCDTDLKRWMDRNGKGPSNPLPTEQIKVGANGIV